MIQLSRRLLERIKRHAVSSYPEECCGVLLGRKQGKITTVSNLLELRNTVDESRTQRFLVTPDEYRMAEREATREGLEIVGIYHSHPDHPARPSPFDLEHALPWWSYVIVSASKGQTRSISSWTMKDDRSAFEEETIEIVSGHSEL